MINILCIETAEKACSVALSQDGVCVDELKELTANSHSTALTVMIGDLLEKNKIGFSDLDAVAVSAGPGSYTGLRVGVSTAKGICWAKEKPLIAIDTLTCIKEHGKTIHGDFEVIIPNIDARRNEVFLSIFEHNKETKTPTPFILEENPLLGFEHKKCLIVGSGATKFTPFTTSDDLIDENILPSAKYLCRVAFEKFEKKQFEDVAYFEPLYFKAVHVMKSKKKIFG